jgi:hypothetical protein
LLRECLVSGQAVVIGGVCDTRNTGDKRGRNGNALQHRKLAAHDCSFVKWKWLVNPALITER